MTDFVYGNILTGEEHKTKKHILVLNAEPFYSEFLIQVLKSNSVKSPHPVIAFFAGDKILVISGEGLSSCKGPGVEVDEEMDEWLSEIHKEISKLNDLVSRFIDEYFPELEDEY